MGLLDKIEDKLSSNKDNKLEKQQQNDKYGSNTGSSGTTSKLQHPIANSSGSPYGTAVGNTSGQASDGYGPDSSGYTSSNRDRMPGSHTTEETREPTHTTTTSTTTGARHPVDPYSSKGQETAARHGGTTIGHSNEQDYSRTGRDDVDRSRDGGILNQRTDQQHSTHQSSDPRYGTHQSSDPRYDANQSSDSRYGTQQSSDPRYGTHQTSSTSPATGSHHYGRDAAMAGGAGAAGIGAYEVGKNHPSSQPLTAGAGHQQQYQDDSYRSQPQHTSRDGNMSGGAMEPGMMGSHSQGGLGSHTQGGVSGESSGMTQAKKMGGAYEAGYKDAMEHMRNEMAQKGQGNAF